MRNATILVEQHPASLMFSLYARIPEKKIDEFFNYCGFFPGFNPTQTPLRLTGLYEIFELC